MLNLIPRTRNWLRREAAFRLARRPVGMSNPEPLISFTFDDFPRSALTNGGSILHQHGLAGTFFASFGLMGQNAPTGEIFLPEDLVELGEQKHEVGCHTFDHCHSWETPPGEFEQSILRNRAALSRYAPGQVFVSFSYPISGPRYETKRRVGRHFACCRGGGQRPNTITADLNYLNAFFIEQSRETPGAIERLIQQNGQDVGWLIFATHDIADQATRFGCTPRLFEKIVSWSVKSGARVLPMYEALCHVAPDYAAKAVGATESKTVHGKI